MMVSRRPRTDTQTPMIEMTLSVNGVGLFIKPTLNGFGRMSWNGSDVISMQVHSKMLHLLLTQCNTRSLTTRTAKFVRWLQEQVTLPWEPSVKFVQPLSVQFPTPSESLKKKAPVNPVIMGAHIIITSCFKVPGHTDHTRHIMWRL